MIDISDYSLEKCLFWGVFAEHCQWADASFCAGAYMKFFVHGILAILEIFPGIGQIISLAEKILFSKKWTESPVSPPLPLPPSNGLKTPFRTKKTKRFLFQSPETSYPVSPRLTPEAFLDLSYIPGSPSFSPPPFFTSPSSMLSPIAFARNPAST